jgi:hypothetical protein
VDIASWFFHVSIVALAPIRSDSFPPLAFSVGKADENRKTDPEHLPLVLDISPALKPPEIEQFSSLCHFSNTPYAHYQVKMVYNHFALLLAPFILCLGYVAAETDSSTKAIYQHYAITGVHSGVNTATGARPPRRNILDMEQDPVMLYVAFLPWDSCC